MGMLGGLFGGDGFKEVEGIIQAVNEKRGDTEAKYRNRLETAFQEQLGILTKREGGVAGLGTRVDIYMQYKDVDYLVTIKFNITEQKAKVLLGEMLILRLFWKPREPAKRTYVLVVLCGKMGTKEHGHLEPLLSGAGFLCVDGDSGTLFTEAEPPLEFKVYTPVRAVK